jgi:predicted Rdx family selenoprotein
VAALIKDQLSLDSDLEPGGRGEFSIWLDDKKIAEKSRSGFPSETAIVDLVRKAVE